jgi:aspartyl-tRNA(Asn)/glutamyl-tRNA(Gln) amidotransferase subunit C
MSLSRAEVEKIALLSRLLLSEEEIERMTVQLGEVLGYMELLGEVDTTGVEPMVHARDMTNVFREDVVRASLDRSQALANAPHRDDECYLVPAVL